MTTYEADVLVIGSGAAGLVTALSAAPRRVMLLSASDANGNGAATQLAQGGIAAAIGLNDSPLQHIVDTLRAGHPENSIAAVSILCEEAAAAIDFLSAQGVEFDRARPEHLLSPWSFHHEAAHTRPRVLHANGDGTGAHLLSALHACCSQAAHIETLPAASALRLLTQADGVTGVLATRDNESIAIRARDVVLATGGIGGLYWKTTNPLSACGDGIAMALQAGAHCAQLEFVQFHPTALDIDSDPLPLVTEALRGAGACLVNDRDERFMHGFDPQGDLAPRDVVARAIWQQLSTGRKVSLRVPPDILANLSTLFPALAALCLRHRIDVAASGIPITPAAHYHMGGVAADLLGRTSLAHLWAVGEVACNGVHGANRLASNSLLEAVVFGRRAGQSLAERTADKHRAANACLGQHEEARTSHARKIWTGLRMTLWQHMGIVRQARGMQAALATVRLWRDQCLREDSCLDARLNLVEQMLLSALSRRESCGAHCVI